MQAKQRNSNYLSPRLRRIGGPFRDRRASQTDVVVYNGDRKAIQRKILLRPRPCSFPKSTCAPRKAACAAWW